MRTKRKKKEKKSAGIKLEPDEIPESSMSNTQAIIRSCVENNFFVFELSYEKTLNYNIEKIQITYKTKFEKYLIEKKLRRKPDTWVPLDFSNP